MLDEATRQSYLESMGVTQWKLRTVESASEPAPVQAEPVPAELIPAEPVPVESSIKGLKWLNKGSQNGLLVIMSGQAASLSPEGRTLMGKMLNGIHFLPSETGFALTEQPTTETPTFSLTDVKAVLVFGNKAGRELVKLSGAEIVPGTEIFTLDGRKMVATLHPDEVLSNPELKPQVWADLKQLVELFNSQQ